jgi:hypothetical protein
MQTTLIIVHALGTAPETPGLTIVSLPGAQRVPTNTQESIASSYNRDEFHRASPKLCLRTHH